MPRVSGNHMSNHISYHAEEIINGKGYISVSNREIVSKKFKYLLVTVSLALIFYPNFSPYLKSIPSTLEHYSHSSYYYYTWQPMNDYSFQK